MIDKIKKFINKHQNGEFKALIEEIGTGRKKDLLMISNRKRNLWILSLFNGYKQLGTMNIEKPHEYKEGDLITATIEQEKIKNIKKEYITISNINEIHA